MLIVFLYRLLLPLVGQRQRESLLLLPPGDTHLAAGARLCRSRGRGTDKWQEFPKRAPRPTCQKSPPGLYAVIHPGKAAGAFFLLRPLQLVEKVLRSASIFYAKLSKTGHRPVLSPAGEQSGALRAPQRENGGSPPPFHTIPPVRCFTKSLFRQAEAAGAFFLLRPLLSMLSRRCMRALLLFHMGRLAFRRLTRFLHLLINKAL